MFKECNYWLFSSNYNTYDALGAFSKFSFVDWGTTYHLEEDDIVYIYVGKPIYKILIKTEVISSDIPSNKKIDDSEFIKNPGKLPQRDMYVRLGITDSFIHKEDYLSFDTLITHGFKYTHHQFKLNCYPELLAYIKMIEI